MTGGWQDDLRHGFGSYFYLNRDVYSGEWVEHIRHGAGKYTYASNGVVYTGNWERGRRTGSGAVSVLSREVLSKVLEVCYSKETVKKKVYHFYHVVE